MRKAALTVTAMAGAAAAAATLAAAPAPAIRHAMGSFTVAATPEAQIPAPPGGLPSARTALSKTFTGGLMATASGTMLSVGTPRDGVAAYVAIDQVAGTLDGRRGGFVLLHRGTLDGKGASELAVSIAPGSGTGALAGIAGTLSIEVAGGIHRYDLAYTLP